MDFRAVFAFILLSFLLKTLSAATFRDGDVRLVGGSYQWEGRVEIFFAGSWGTITDSDWTSEDAQAVCRTMGNFRPGAMEFAGAYFGQGSGPIHYDHIVCSGMEYNLTDCETGTGSRQSSHDEDVGVKCNTIDDNYREGNIRLVGGPHNWEGRVEIFWSGIWGTFSDTNWETLEAQVVCKQLGLPPGSVTSAHYGKGTGLIQMTANCSGSESDITECSLATSIYANHENDVGVNCGKGPDYKNGDVRLVGGSYSWEGRVQMYINGEWGTFSQSATDAVDALVACRQLGYDTRYGYTAENGGYDYRFVTEGEGRHQNYLHCTGVEYRLLECEKGFWSWGHYHDWGIFCKNDVPEEGAVKLYYYSRYPDFHMGLLHVWLNGQWGTVSDITWTTENALTVCHQLGRNGAEIEAGYFDVTYALPIIMSNVSCLGIEEKLIECIYEPGDYRFPLVSVACSPEASCNYGDMRLTGGSTELEGRVEMCSSRSMWGTVCGNQWTEANSKVVCRSLGFDDDEGPYQVLHIFGGEPNIPVVVDYVRCQGSENWLRECVQFSHSFSECDHDDDIGIRCKPAQCEDGDIKLQEGVGVAQERMGIVLVCFKKRWGAICNSNTQANLRTVCGQLGYSGGFRYYYYNSDRFSRLPVRLASLSCPDEQSRIFDCPYRESNNSQTCSELFNVYCSPAYCTDGQVRLVDGATDVEGRVEICFSRRWETISGDGWTQTESTVVCNDLGYEPSDGSDYSVRPATNSMPVFIKDVRCTGREMSLLECGYRRNLTHSSHFEDVGVQCKKPDCADGDIKLLGGGSNKDGALQVCFDQRWGTVSGDGWTAIDTQVACRQLEFNSTGRHYKTTATYALSTPIYMDNVGCHGTETRLTDCAYHRDTSEDRHSGDIWIECDPASDPGPGPEIESDDSKSGGGNNDTLEKGSQDGLVVALVALVISLLVTFALVGYIIFTKQKVLFKRIRIHYHKSSRGKDDASVMIDNDESDSRVYVESEITHS